jgi:hypothetical protein
MPKEGSGIAFLCGTMMKGTHVGIIAAADIQAGMVLGSDVKDRSGRVLLTGGTELTEKHIWVFKMWGVTEANIKGVAKGEIADSSASQVDPAVLAQAEAATREIFTHVNLDHPAMKEMFRLSTLRTARKIMQDADGH